MCQNLSFDEDGRAHIPLEDYCFVQTCMDSPTERETHFDTCEQTTSDYPRCGWKRFTGCGMIQYERIGDESSYYLENFDGQTGELLGVIIGSDSNVFCGGQTHELTAGFVEQNLAHYWDGICDDIEQMYCCVNEE